jgi:bifunctional DNA-binding transcriptional regulator/antitoxin component of YhaV-PrlF toxin-antitoxin module
VTNTVLPPINTVTAGVGQRVAMSAPEPLAVVGPEGSLVLPLELRRRHGLEPGVMLRINERPDGVLELHRSGAASQADVPPDFWAQWLEAAGSPEGGAGPPHRETPPA